MKSIEIDREEQQFRLFMMKLQHMLHCYIADTNQHEVWDRLYEFFKDENIVVISKEQFLYYEQLRKLSIESLNLTGLGE